MAHIDDEIKRLIRQTVEGDAVVFQGVVTEVDETEFTCTVRRDGEVDYFEVRLRGLVKGSLQGFAFIPRVQSVVLVAHIGRSNELFVCQFTEIDKVIFTDNDLSFLLDTEKIDIRKGEKITVHVDAEKLEIVNDKVKVLQEGTALTVRADRTTVKASSGGVTITRNGSGLKKTLDNILTAIQALTVVAPMGVTSTPVNSATFAQIQADLPNYLEG